MTERTIVGVPLHIRERPETLKFCLENIDDCLSFLGIDAGIIVGVNGEGLSDENFNNLCGTINRSRYNADISFIRTRPGIVNATKAIGEVAEEQGCGRIFLTDADISRLPRSLYYMWRRGEAPIIGANYSAYPEEIMIRAGVGLTPQEIAFMRIFEADKHPLMREFTFPHRPRRRLKGSLLLVDLNFLFRMYGSQQITSDSVMNMRVLDRDRQLIPSAGFFHFARVDLTDHFIGRLRHFRAAASEGRLKEFVERSIIYDRETATRIAARARNKDPGLSGVISNFLIKCALEKKVTEICGKIASGRSPDISTLNTEVDILDLQVNSLEEAERIVSGLLGKYLKVEELYGPVTKGRGLTNGRFRVPIDLKPFLGNDYYRGMLCRYLGLPEGVEV